MSSESEAAEDGTIGTPSLQSVEPAGMWVEVSDNAQSQRTRSRCRTALHV